MTPDRSLAKRSGRVHSNFLDFSFDFPSTQGTLPEPPYRKAISSDTWTRRLRVRIANGP
jgi:hypothetical protein